MASFDNPWIGYVDRSYQQIKDQAITNMQANVPEITDHTESNLFIKIISIWAAIAEMVGYYVDSAAREVFLSTARRYESAVKIAKLFDYRLRGVVAASVELTFTLSATVGTDVTVPAGTVVTNDEGLEFYTLGVLVISAGQLSGTVQAEQKVLDDGHTYSTTGVAGQIVELMADIVDKQITVSVDSQQYTFVESLAFSGPTDQVFTAAVNEDKKMYLLFGDGFNGILPGVGLDIDIAFYTSAGAGGNLAEDTLTTIVSPITVPEGQSISVNNAERSSGGADLETLTDLKRSIPLSIRTLENAVTKQDFIDIAELVAGVRRATVVYDCGAEVEVYVAPEGGGLASDTLIAAVLDAFYDETRLILMDIGVKSAGEVKIILQADVEVLAVFNQSLVEAAVRTNILNFLSVDNQEISGAVRIGDIYQIIENTEGVNSSVVNTLSMVPTARRVVGDSDLTWARTLLSGSTEEMTWNVKYIDNDEFEVTRNGVFLGVLNQDTEYNFEQIRFTIQDNAEYEAGDEWEFKTYAFGTIIDLNEPSIPVAYTGDVTLNMSGGI